MIAGPVRKERRKAGKESAIGPYREGYFPHLPKFILPADEASDGLLAEAVSRPQRRFGGMALEAGRRNGQHDTRTHVAHCGGKFGIFKVSQSSLIGKIDEQAPRRRGLDRADKSHMGIDVDIPTPDCLQRLVVVIRSPQWC